MAKKKHNTDKANPACLTNFVCRKNDELVLDICDMGNEGEGIGKVEGYTLFVKDTIIGDKVLVKVMKTRKHFGYARLLQILEPSHDRVEPVCRVAKQCGGCQLQHCSYERQLQWKQDKILNCLKRIGGFEVFDVSADSGSDAVSAVEPVMGMEQPYYYRNKAQFPVGTDRNGELVAGFYANRTHNIIANMDCCIQHPCNRVIVETVLQFMRDYRISAYDEVNHTGCVRHILTRVGIHTGEIMVCLVINGERIPQEQELVKRLLKCELLPMALAVNDGQVADNKQGISGTEKDCQGQQPHCRQQGMSSGPRLPGEGLTRNQNHGQNQQEQWHIASICLNHNMDKTNVILGREITVLYGNGYIHDTIGRMMYQISPLSFYQVNPIQTKKLYDTVLEFADLKGDEIVWDLYCGIGTISLYMAQMARKVYGVEIVPQAIEDARKNAVLNHMDNAEFFVGAAEDVVPEKYEESGGRLFGDVVTLDPPRKGCDERLLETVVEMAPGKIIYVSCDPGTLARDLRYLCDRGYELKRVRGCDMFPLGYHVESVCLLHRRDS